MCSKVGMMIISYLEKNYSDMIKRKIKLEVEQNDINAKIEEGKKYIEYLKREDEKNFDAFSPRKQNLSLRKKIEHKEEVQNVFLNSLAENKKKILEIDSEIKKLENVLRAARRQDVICKKNSETKIEDIKLSKLKILENQESERREIAQGLNSSLKNYLDLIHKIDFCTKLVDMDSVRCKLELSSVSKNLKDIAENVEQDIFDLYPVYDEFQLDTLIEGDLIRLEQENIGAKCSIEGQVYTLQSFTVLSLYRVVHEALNNVVSHADASMVSVKLRYEKSQLSIVIADDGNGFLCNDEGKNDNSGFGLFMMRERVNCLSGKIQVESEIGVGTMITIEVPTVC